MDKKRNNTRGNVINKLSTPPFWHKTSFNKFLNERLAVLLSNRLPLAGFQVETTGKYVCKVKISISSTSGNVNVEYGNIPQPDDEGIFEISGKRSVVVPTASSGDLEKAEIHCVGEQLYNYIEEHLGESPHDLSWDESLVRAWLPLDKWINKFLQGKAQRIDDSNWLAKFAYLRRITFCKPVSMEERGKLFIFKNFGRACPFETPEGPNIGYILSVAVGAEIRDGKINIINNQPEATLSLTSSMVPFLEHNDPNRQLMGVNLMRQWFVPPDPEPALVQTGNEPDVQNFWCGRNLLTAFVSWGADTFEDGIIISQSAAKRLNYPQPVEPGDQISNRHGSKGVVSRIMPDEKMPHLSDGTPVELVYSFLGCQSRLNFGQIREAIMGRIAHADGKPAIVPPFHAPGEHELRERLSKSGLPESGMEILSLGRNGKKLLRPSTVGWVYWGRTCHIARDKIHTSVSSSSQRLGELEYYALREVGAFENIRECLNIRFAGRPDAGKVIPSAGQTAEALNLNIRVATGKMEQAKAPTPMFSALVRRLAVAGIRAEFKHDKLTCKFARPEGAMLKLARPVAHPWLRTIHLSEIGVFEELPEYDALVEANGKLERMLTSQAPESLANKAFKLLEIRVKEFFNALLNSKHLQFGGRVFFSARAIIAPSVNLRLDQIGLAEQIAWDLFGPLVTQELGKEKEVRDRSKCATKTLDEIMAQSWVIVNRAPTITPTCLLAFHPVRLPEHVIRLHPLACRLMNADFDGDQAAIYLPVTDAAQREAGENLSIAAHLKRDPDLIRLLVPSMEPMWGLASLSLIKEGKEEITKFARTRVMRSQGFITQDSLEMVVRMALKREGVEKTFALLDQLMRHGFEIAKESGASINPFITGNGKQPAKPISDDPTVWDAYSEEVKEWVASNGNFADNGMGPQLLAIKSHARGSVQHFLRLISSLGTVVNVSGASVIIHHGYCDGLTPEEVYTVAIIARERLIRVFLEMEEDGYNLREISRPRGFNVLARALRAEYPGIVFARAAANGEIDPLTDVDSRLFAGLPIVRCG